MKPAAHVHDTTRCELVYPHRRTQPSGEPRARVPRPLCRKPFHSPLCHRDRQGRLKRTSRVRCSALSPTGR